MAQDHAQASDLWRAKMERTESLNRELQALLKQHVNVSPLGTHTKIRKNGSMPRPGNQIHIPLKTDEALRVALQVKPTADMPRPGGASNWTKEETR